MLFGYGEGIAFETLIHLNVISGPDHWYFILGSDTEDEMTGMGLELIVPGITTRELEYIRECLEFQTLMGTYRTMPEISAIDGNHYYRIFGDSITQMEIR